jgi:hypothetical protein
MSFQRRQLLQILAYAFGSSFNLPQNELVMAAQNSAQAASPAPPVKTAAKQESGGTEMERRKPGTDGTFPSFLRADLCRRLGRIS